MGENITEIPELHHMTNLAECAGIDVQWAADGTLKFGSNIVVDETFPRPLSRLRPVALEPNACEPDDQVQYWMYNGIARVQERERLQASGMRYEFTLMFPHALGHERAKTLGHLHSFPPNQSLNYPEVCEVLHGSAYFVFQTVDLELKQSTFCAVVEAHAGDTVIIPPNLHHLTINAGDEPLLFSDVIPLAVKGIYEPLMTMHGAAYLYTVDDEWIPNPAYQVVPELQHGNRLANPEFFLPIDVPLYRVFAEQTEWLSWMLTPLRFGEIFPDLRRVVRMVTAV
jgi:glucose-6-phosphate isomerase, archaeal